jgi:hypothetical protein
MTITQRPGVAAVPVATRRHFRHRSIPAAISKDEDSIYATVDALREVVETLVAQRGDPTLAAVLRGDFDPPLTSDILTATNHMRVVEPYSEHPHPQYWHHALDPAWSEMYITEDTGPFISGDTILPWLEGDVSAYRITHDATLGEATMPADGGMYMFMITMTARNVGGGGTHVYDFDIFENEFPTGHDFHIALGIQDEFDSTSWQFLLFIAPNVGATYTIRCTGATDAFVVEDAQWTIFRYSPAPGSLGPGYPAGIILSVDDGFNEGFWT